MAQVVLRGVIMSDQRRWRWFPALFLITVAVVSACGGDPAEDTALLRGDRAFARGDYDEALAEYRLSLLQEEPGIPGLVRNAHAPRFQLSMA